MIIIKTVQKKVSILYTTDLGNNLNMNSFDKQYILTVIFRVFLGKEIDHICQITMKNIERVATLYYQKRKRTNNIS